MTIEQTLEEYFSAIHGGDWQQFIADGMTYGFNSYDQPQGRNGYLEGAGNFFRATTGVEIKQKVINGSHAALIARYNVRSPKGTTGTCDVAEFLTIKDGKLTASSIFFDTKAFGELMQS